MAGQLQVDTLDHLGLVAGVIDELGLVELTDELLRRHELNCASVPGESSPDTSLSVVVRWSKQCSSTVSVF